MDRLSTVIGYRHVCRAVCLFVGAVAVGALAACPDDSGKPGTARERVNAVKADPVAEPSLKAFCDVYPAPAAAPAFAWPELTGRPPAAAGTWRWVNVWATWCKPCIEEMPRLRAWRAKLARRGVQFALDFISADVSDDVVDEFRARHPGTPAGLRMRDPDAVAAWLAPMGGEAATLPIHVFVDPRGKVRCIRASGVSEDDYPAVEALLSRRM
jgi:thiol-disulfide isomerase/thioredoxin